MASSNVDTEVQGQGEKVRVREHHVVADTVILDPASDEAVQVPEGIGADSTVNPIHTVEAHERGTAEEQFASEEQPADAEVVDEPEADDGDEADEPVE